MREPTRGAPMKLSIAVKATLWLVAGVVGALLFWLVQAVTGGPTITEYLGEEIVSAGGYPAAWASVVGWLVHFGVSLSYALLFGLILVLLRHAPFATSTLVSLGAALALAYLTALIAPPAISVTIAVLGGRGWPEEIFPLNTQFGLPVWNHVAFFVLNWAIQGIGARLVATNLYTSAPPP